MISLRYEPTIETRWDFRDICPSVNMFNFLSYSWSQGNATLVAAKRSGRRRDLGASKPRPSAKVAHPYRKRACLEALRLATTIRTQRGAGYPSWGHPTQLRISRGSTGLIYGRNWLLYLQRMPQNRIPLKSYHYRPQGRRTIGRPKKRWRKQL